MLDSIREIFDILDIEFESVRFDFIQYKNFEEITDAINNGKCPIVDVLRKYLYSSGKKKGTHAMVATGIKNDKGNICLQLKNSYADDPNQGCPPKFEAQLSKRSVYKISTNSGVCSLQFERLARMRGRRRVKMDFQNEKWISF